MSKKKESKEKKLSPVQYWEWRCSIEELQHAETKVSASKVKLKLMEAESKIKKLEITQFMSQVRALNAQYMKIKEDYFKYKEDLEKDLGFSLDGCAINPIDFSVNKIEED